MYIIVLLIPRCDNIKVILKEKVNDLLTYFMIKMIDNVSNKVFVLFIVVFLRKYFQINLDFILSIADKRKDLTDISNCGRNLSLTVIQTLGQN